MPFPTASPETVTEAFARGGWHWPPGYEPFRIGRCSGRRCEHLVLWAIFTRSGRLAPFNRDGISHFATCPHAPAYRRLKRSST